MRTHKEIAEEILGYPIDENGNAPCPGAQFHTTQNGVRDWRIWFDDGGKPHESCYHQNCQAARDEFMKQLYRAIAQEERGYERTPVPRMERPLPAVPKALKVKADELDYTLALEVAEACPENVTEEWLVKHSRVPIPEQASQWGELMLNELYPKGTRILVFTEFASQGQFMYVVGYGVFRLGNKPDVKAVKSDRLPKGGRNGVWYLVAPVTGAWKPNPNKKDANGNMMPGRRHGDCCTGFPYLVLESDNLEPELWLRILAQLIDPVVAVYTSGGKSIHALVRVDAETPEQFAVMRAEYIERLTCVGADAAAITPVRLSRLPGCLRYGSGNETYPEPRMQRLLYLNPAAEWGMSILDWANGVIPPSCREGAGE